MDVERIPALVTAIFIVGISGIISGPLMGNANPFFWGAYDRIFGRLGDRLDKAQRPHGDLVFRGFIFAVTLILLSFFIANFAQYTAQPLLYEGLFVSLCLTSGSVWYVLLKIYFALDTDEIVEGAYYTLSRSSGIDLNSVDDYGITRVGLSFSAIAFDKGMVAPAIWYLIGGLPLLFVYSALSFMAWRFGRFGFNRHFASVMMALEKLMGLVPSLFAGFIYVVASAITPTARIGKAILLWWSRKGRAPYEQGGIVLSALSWPLNVTLGGTVRGLRGESIALDWVGPEGASAKVTKEHLKRGIFLNVVANLLFIVALLSAYLYGHWLPF